MVEDSGLARVNLQGGGSHLQDGPPSYRYKTDDISSTYISLNYLGAHGPSATSEII